MLLFGVSIENFGFSVSTPFFFLKNVFLNCKMSKMHVNHSHVAVDFEKILQRGSAKRKTAKLLNIALNSKRYRSLSIWTFSQEVNQ